MTNPQSATEVISPLTRKHHVKRVEELDVERIKSLYKASFGMDVSYLPSELSIFECMDTGLRFFHPLSAAGDEKFYEQLAQSREGYYSEWKWEYEVAASLINPENSLLEIGCGNGYFLKAMEDKGVFGVGLEFNDYAVQNAKTAGLNVRKESIQDHAALHPESYDVVCSFQVFEHTPEIADIITAAIQALKPGGLFIFGVPNNDSYIYSHYRYHPLNLPPHHILLWDKESLERLPSLFPSIRLRNLSYQPETKISRSMCYKVWLYQRLGENAVARLVHKLTRPLVKGPLKSIISFGPNETVVAIYEKAP